MTRTTKLVAMMMLAVLMTAPLLSRLGYAQEPSSLNDTNKFSAFIGAGVDADTQLHPTGAAALITELTDKTFAFSAFTVRGDVDGRPITSVTQGLMYQAFRVERLAIYANANGGVAQSGSATTGAFSAGTVLGYAINERFELLIGALGSITPAEPGENLKFIVGLRLKK